MPYHRQYDKSIRQDAKRNLRNQDAKSKMRTSVKKVRSAQSKEEAQEALKKAASLIDTIARKGIIKKNTAARKKSRLSKAIAKMS